jgi:predicted transcriptional regulator|tara:strand:- start:260 stop:490 length:231 start_codon:yes stop_codon:yes gene_type:complete
MGYTETRRKIFLAMAKNGGAKMSDMAADNGISKMRTRYHIARIRSDFEGIYTFKVTPIGSEQYGQSDAIFNAIHNT